MIDDHRVSVLPDCLIVSIAAVKEIVDFLFFFFGAGGG